VGRTARGRGAARRALAAEALARIGEDRERMLAFARDLVAIPTENPPGRSYPECARRIAAELQSLGLAPRTLPVPAAPRANARSDGAGGGRAPVASASRIVLAEAGRGGRALYFHGHYDVVPASRAGQFEPIVRGGRLLGRGTGDMKGGLAAMVYAARALASLGAPLRGHVALVCVPDEETGGARGSAWLAKLGRLGRDGLGMLSAEPTSGVVWNACRGAITLRVTVRGRPAHVGLHHRGVNAFARMLPIARALSALERRVRRRTTRFAIAPAAARRSILLLGGECTAGTNFNVVPGECRFTVDRRLNPEEDFVTERRRLLACIEEFRRSGTDMAVEVFQEGHAAAAPADHPVGRALRDSVREVTGRAPRFELCPGLLENRFYTARGVPAYCYGPGTLESAHGPDEYVELRRLHECAAIYALTALRLIGPEAGA
jgi:acetylornithine deacetylase/succinyl-diaminopimelate desuccinylase family protein